MQAKLPLDVYLETENLLKRRVEFILPSLVRAELERISKRRSQTGRYADLALKIASRCKLIELPLRSEETVDDALVRLATQTRCVIATGDLELAKRLRKSGIPVIRFRDNRLFLEGIEPGYL
jgi:rRNA-processing protein FCF1